jgi:hypothetical protein
MSHRLDDIAGSNSVDKDTGNVRKILLYLREPPYKRSRCITAHTFFSLPQMKHINSDTLHTAPNSNTTWADMTARDRTVYNRSTKFSPTHLVTAVLRPILLPSSPTHSVCLPNYISPHITCFLNFSALQSQHINPVLTYQHLMYIYPLTVKTFTSPGLHFHSFQMPQHINSYLPRKGHYHIFKPHKNNRIFQTPVSNKP